MEQTFPKDQPLVQLQIFIRQQEALSQRLSNFGVGQDAQGDDCTRVIFDDVDNPPAQMTLLKLGPGNQVMQIQALQKQGATDTLPATVYDSGAQIAVVSYRGTLSPESANRSSTTPDQSAVVDSSIPSQVLSAVSSKLPSVDLLITKEFDIDVDGAPNAYAPPATGPTLDFELNAHVGARSTGAVVGYIVDPSDPTNARDSAPKQTENDPAPGYYISTTAFQDSSNPNILDPDKYVNAAKINYVVRGQVAEDHAVSLGDIVAVFSIGKNRAVFGVVGDSGNSSGAEGSLALLQNLGYPFTTGKSGSAPANDIIVRYFPKSNISRQFFISQRNIDDLAKELGLSKDFSQHVT